MKRVLLLTNILSPYRIPLFNALAERLSQHYHFKIAFMAYRESNREWRVRTEELKAQHVILSGWHFFLQKSEWELHFNPHIWRFLRKEKPDVIISGGYSYPSNWVAALYRKLYRKKLILWTSTTLECVKSKDLLRSFLRRLFIMASDAFVTYGRRAADFLRELGEEDRRIFIGCNVGDVELFRTAVAQYRMNKVFQTEKKQFNSFVLLYVGQFIQRKGILQLLTALKEIKKRPWTLIMVGSGPLQPQILDMIEQNGWEDRVFLVGFKEKEELIKYYALADIFVLPSLLEPYAIVVSEALASGLFVIASKYAGASWDLITGKNGIAVDSLNIDSLRSAIQKAFDLTSSSSFLRDEIVQSVIDFTPDKYAKSFVEAIKYVAAVK